MNLSEVLSIEGRIYEIESELEADISESAKDSLYTELFRLEDRMDRLYGNREEYYPENIDDEY